MGWAGISATVVIPARGGSRGVSRKNMRSVGGMPLVARAAHTGMRSKLGVVVSTDDAEIAAAVSWFVTVDRRPPALRGDDVTTEAVLLDMVHREVVTTDAIALVQCTSPFVTEWDIVDCVNALAEDPALSCVYTVADFTRVLAGEHQNGPRKPRQTRAPGSIEAGGVYAIRVAHLIETGSRFGHRSTTVRIPEWRAHEIDTYDDLRTAQALARMEGDGWESGSQPKPESESGQRGGTSSWS